MVCFTRLGCQIVWVCLIVWYINCRYWKVYESLFRHGCSTVLNSLHLAIFAGWNIQNYLQSSGSARFLKKKQCTEFSLLITEPYLPALAHGHKHINRHTCTFPLVQDFRQSSMCPAINPSTFVYKCFVSSKVNPKRQKRKRLKLDLKLSSISIYWLQHYYKDKSYGYFARLRRCWWWD